MVYAKDKYIERHLQACETNKKHNKTKQKNPFFFSALQYCIGGRGRVVWCLGFKPTYALGLVFRDICGAHQLQPCTVT